MDTSWRGGIARWRAQPNRLAQTLRHKPHATIGAGCLVRGDAFGWRTNNRAASITKTTQAAL